LAYTIYQFNKACILLKKKFWTISRPIFISYLPINLNKSKITDCVSQLCLISNLVIKRLIKNSLQISNNITKRIYWTVINLCQWRWITFLFRGQISGSYDNSFDKTLTYSIINKINFKFDVLDNHAILQNYGWIESTWTLIWHSQKSMLRWWKLMCILLCNYVVQLIFIETNQWSHWNQSMVSETNQWSVWNHYTVSHCSSCGWWST
jgi:hypothetical protein